MSVPASRRESQSLLFFVAGLQGSNPWFHQGLAFVRGQRDASKTKRHGGQPKEVRTTTIRVGLLL